MPVIAEWWPDMKDHAERRRLWRSKARHRVAAAGRGSGKSEDGARILLLGDDHHLGAINPPAVAAPLFVIAAPTRDQVKNIWWKRIKGMVPAELLAGPPRESDLEINLRTGSTIRLVGLDKPHRVEGVSIDGLLVDEFAEVKRDSWESALEPTLNRLGRPGWAYFIGRPKGRGNFFDLWSKAKVLDGWESFHWTSEVVMGSEWMAKKRAEMDELVFRQEYLADWVTFEGLAYYPWTPNVHYRALSYDPALPIVCCFDFNVDPGTCAILQEQNHKHAATGDESVATTCAIDEVHIPRNSNTSAVCRALLAKIKSHAGDVMVYGDPSGGARRSSSDATDWDIVRDHLRPVFGERLRWRVAKRAPFIRDRVNAVNCRLRATSGHVRFLADPRKVPRIVADFEGVTLLEGGSGEIDKKGCEDKGLTHLSEAIGYYIHEKFPVAAGGGMKEW